MGEKKMTSRMSELAGYLLIVAALVMFTNSGFSMLHCKCLFETLIHYRSSIGPINR